MPEPVQIMAVAGAEIVEDTDFLRLVLIVLDDVGADEPGAASDEDFHVGEMMVAGMKGPDSNPVTRRAWGRSPWARG